MLIKNANIVNEGMTFRGSVLFDGEIISSVLAATASHDIDESFKGKRLL